LSYFLYRKRVAKFKLFIVYSEEKTDNGPLEIKLCFSECQIYLAGRVSMLIKAD